MHNHVEDCVVRWIKTAEKNVFLRFLHVEAGNGIW